MRPTTDRRTILALSSVGALGALAGCALRVPEDAGGASNEPAPADNGVVTVTVPEETVEAAFDRITASIEAADELTTVAALDHSENATTVDMELPPTRVVLFGNPAAGTPIMQASQRAGLDLPQRMVVWQDGGQTKISYNDPTYIADRHGIEGQDERLENIATVLEAIATGER